MKKIIKLDCRFFLGYKPCRFKRLCYGCRDYKPMGTRILVIKLAAAGDVLRTTPILRGLKRKYPASYIVWITDKEAFELLQNNNLIDALLVYSYENVLSLQQRYFNIVINLDKDIPAAALATSVNAGEKIGFGLTLYGTLCSLNTEADYIFELGLSDKLKFRTNTLTYQKMCFDACKLNFKQDEYIFDLSEDVIVRAKKFWKEHDIKDDDIVIGLNTGAGKTFPTKKWPVSHVVDLAKKLASISKVKVALLGGPLEVSRNIEILSQSKGSLIDTGCNNTLLEFAVLLKRCNLIVTCDTLAMHLAIAQKIPVIALFGSTAEQEVEIYGRGIKIKSRIACAPCYKNECSTTECMRMITPGHVFKSCVKVLSSMQRRKRCSPK